MSTLRQDFPDGITALNVILMQVSGCDDMAKCQQGSPSVKCTFYERQLNSYKLRYFYFLFINCTGAFTFFNEHLVFTFVFSILFYIPHSILFGCQ